MRRVNEGKEGVEEMRIVGEMRELGSKRKREREGVERGRDGVEEEEQEGRRE